MNNPERLRANKVVSVRLAAGRAALGILVTSGTDRRYIDDYKLLMIATIAPFPLPRHLQEIHRDAQHAAGVERARIDAYFQWGRISRSISKRRVMDRVSSMLSFVKVVEHGGFSSAGRQLNLATSVVTTHVKALEERLGVRLLNRTTRNVTLTEAGKAYYERCVQILSEIEDAEDAAQTLQSKPRGVLRLNTNPATPALIAPSIAEYTDLYPDVTIHLTVTSRMLDLVEQGYDLAIWMAAVPDPRLIRRHLASYRAVLCASQAYLAKHGRPKHPSELVKHKCLIYYDAVFFGKDGREWLFTGPDGAFSVHVPGSLETNSRDALRAAALAGQGFLFVPTPMIVDELRSGALEAVLMEFLPREYPIDAFYPHREHLPAKVRTFIDLIAKNFRKIDRGLYAQEGKRPAHHSERAIAATEAIIAKKSSPAPKRSG